MTRLAIDLILMLVAGVGGYTFGLWASDYTEEYQKNLLNEPTINDIKKMIEERDSESEYDTDSKTSPNQTTEKSK